MFSVVPDWRRGLRSISFGLFKFFLIIVVKFQGVSWFWLLINLEFLLPVPRGLPWLKVRESLRGDLECVVFNVALWYGFDYAMSSCVIPGSNFVDLRMAG